MERVNVSLVLCRDTVMAGAVVKLGAFLRFAAITNSRHSVVLVVNDLVSYCSQRSLPFGVGWLRSICW